MTSTSLPTTARREAPESQRNALRPPAVRSTHVLLVEDEPLTAEVFALALTRAGMLVEVARDGLQALRRLQLRTPSAVVLDMSLPALSGAALVRELRQSAAHRLPVVVVSGSEQRLSSLTEAELQPGCWLVKPVKPRHLVEVVHRFCAAAE